LQFAPQNEDIEPAFRRNLRANACDRIIVRQVGRYEMASLLIPLRWRRLTLLPHAAAEHENFGAGAEKMQRDGAPDVSRCSRDQSNRVI
jgi:hypothetical protein